MYVSARGINFCKVEGSGLGGRRGKAESVKMSKRPHVTHTELTGGVSGGNE